MGKKKLSQEELDQMVEHEYISQLKYSNGKIDPILKQKFEALKTRTKKLNQIHAVAIITDAILERRAYGGTYNSFIVIEDINGPCLLYNITTGEDHSFDFNKGLKIIKNTTEIINLYEYDEEDYQQIMDIGYMQTIILYTNVNLINKHSNKMIRKSNFIEFSDRLGNKLYIDIIFENAYVRENSFSIEKNGNSKEVILYEYNKEKEFDKNLFKNLKFKLSKILALFEEE